MFHPGDIIGPYELVRPLGRGAFGEVWLGDRHLSMLAAQVALKLPLEGQADPEVIRREAKTWLQASGHPNIVPFLEADIHQGQIVIASEFVAGGSLAAWIKENGGKAPSLNDAVGMMRGILSGLSFLHRNDLIHRDLKPENILLQDGLPRLADFGLTRALKTGKQTTNVTGTPGYMAPETLQSDYGIASDIWAAGAVLYEMLCGALPYGQKDLFALMLSLSRDEPEPLPDEVPEPIRAVVAKAIAREAGDRYATAHEMASALDEAYGAVRINAASASADRGARIAHVLALQLVGYSQQSASGQGRHLVDLNTAISVSPAVVMAKKTGAVKTIASDDGMAIVFSNDVLAPADAAVEISRALRQSGLPLRMGIHSGLVLPQLDSSGKDNVVGEAVNTARRVMEFGDAGHILLSAQYASWLNHFDQWSSHIHALGDAGTTQSQKISLYSLRGEGYGLASMPSRLSEGAGPQDRKSSNSIADGKRVALLYKPNAQPDLEVLQTLEERLRSLGHDVFVDNHHKISTAWAKAVEEPIRRADAVIAIVSPQSLRSEMLEYEIETAQDQYVRTGKPSILPVLIGAEDPLEGTIASVLHPLHYFSWNSPEDDEKLVAELLSAITEPLTPRVEEVKLEPVGGAVPPESPFYVRRECDGDFNQALDANESILLVKGARQIGKTSLLAQGAKRARDAGWRVAVTDFQKFNTAQMNSDETFYRLLAATLGRQLKWQYDFATNWDEIFGANLNMENFLRDLLDSTEEPLVWFMDEVDKLFTAPFASDFFGLVRSWHNSRSTEPDGPWRKLTVVIAYATEAHLFIQDLNQSPFNVGRRLNLEDFNIQQTIDLNVRYGGPLANYADTETLHTLIGGQPFLTRCALDALATGKEGMTSLLEHAASDEGPFNDHLKRILVSVSRLQEVTEYVRAVLSGSALPHHDPYYRLLSAGIIRQNEAGKVVFRCELYRLYLQRLMSQ